MNILHRRDVYLLLLFIGLYLAAAIAYAFVPSGALETAATFGQVTELAPWQIALGNSGFILLIYIPAGVAGIWLAHKAGLPGIYRSGATPQGWFLQPLGFGLIGGVVVVAFDWLAQRFTDFTGFPHPRFPASLLASISAAVGEEILSRLFVMSLWMVILGWLLRRLLTERKAQLWSFWVANGLAALAFAASHLGTGMVIAGVDTPAALPLMMLSRLDIALRNGQFSTCLRGQRLPGAAPVTGRGFLQLTAVCFGRSRIPLGNGDAHGHRHQ